jgi:hypothetical protein
MGRRHEGCGDNLFPFLHRRKVISFLEEFGALDQLAGEPQYQRVAGFVAEQVALGSLVEIRRVREVL